MRYTHPCDHIPCDHPFEVHAAEVFRLASATRYYPNLWIGPNDHFVFPDHIYKCRTVRMAAGGRVKFNLMQPYNWYAFVVEELKVDIVDSDDFDLVFEWWDQTLGELQKSLIGIDGEKAPDAPITKKGRPGPPGETGGKGGTRHSPHIFLFVRRIVGAEDDLNLTSFHFDLNGVPGGVGGKGGSGGKGDEGRRGKNGKIGNIFTGCTGGKRGRRGGAPGKGGRGGDGGCGGAGPEVQIYYGDQNLRNVFERSKYSVNGGPRPSDDFYGGGEPGLAGQPGRGGKGGKRAGNCGPGKRGPEGEPSAGSDEWNRWNRGRGLPGTEGPDGDYELTPIEPGSIEESVFLDPIPVSG